MDSEISYEKQYLSLIKKVMEKGTAEYNQRTKHLTKRLSGTIISCDLQREWPLTSFRKMYPKTGSSELSWMLMATQDGTWLKKYSKIWEAFEQDGLLKAAYGWRWRKACGRDQIQECIELLKKDPSSRQAVVFAWDPMMDGLANSGKMKNIPCHMGFSALVIGGKLNICVFQRSVDTIVGLGYDILLYGLLNLAMAKSIGVEKGVVSIAFADTHIYDSHFHIADKLIADGEGLIIPQERAFDFNSPTVAGIVADPDWYVGAVIEAMKPFKYSDYAPAPEVVL